MQQVYTYVACNLLHATCCMHSVATMLHVTFSSSKNGGRKKSLSFVCYCGNNSAKVVLYRQGFFHRGQSRRLFSLPSLKMQPFWYSDQQGCMRTPYFLCVPLHVYKSPRPIMCFVVAFLVNPFVTDQAQRVRRRRLTANTFKKISLNQMALTVEYHAKHTQMVTQTIYTRWLVHN